MAIVINGSTGISATESSTVLGDNAVETADIADGAVTAAKLSTGHPNWDSSGNVGINTSSPGAKLEVKASEASGVNLKLTQYNSTDGWTVIADDNGGPLRFVRVGNALNGEAMRIDNSGRVVIGRTSNLDNVFLTIQGNVSNPTLESYQNTTNLCSHLWFRNTNGIVGSITTNGSGTAYNTSSDYRLKENVAPMTGALATVVQLKPVTYTWKVDNSAGQGFIAHELQAVVPDCVTGEKDGEREVDVFDEDGNKTGTKMEPVYQGVDTSFLVATLTAAIQELKAELDAAKERIAILENV